MTVYNFAAGPSMMAPEVKQALAQSLVDWQGTGFSIAEVPHRSQPFVDYLSQTQAMVRHHLGIGQEYEVLFLSGGARTQFALIASQFLKTRATYVVTGHWSAMAAHDAQRYGHVDQVVSNGKIPESFAVAEDSDYVFLCSNETIDGVEFATYPVSPVPLIVDASSDIFARRVDMSNVALLMAGAQKNMGIAGLIVVVVRKDFLAKARQIDPSLSYVEHAKKGNLLVTPCAAAIAATHETLNWLERCGGVEAIEAINREKARTLYREIDASEGFYRNTIAIKDRSITNVVFSLPDESLQEAFLSGAEQRGLVNLRGHRSAGGIRASIYNAMPLQAVQALAAWMQEFKQSNLEWIKQ